MPCNFPNSNPHFIFLQNLTNLQLLPLTSQQPTIKLLRHKLLINLRRLIIQEAQRSYGLPSTSPFQSQEGEMAANDRASFECDAREAAASFCVVEIGKWEI